MDKWQIHDQTEILVYSRVRADVCVSFVRDSLVVL